MQIDRCFIKTPCAALFSFRFKRRGSRIGSSPPSLTMTTLPASLAFVLAILHTVSAQGAVSAARVPGSVSCRADRLTVYRVIFETYWSRQKFPKQYPDWRPVAQWSKLIGRSHNKSYVLWRLGALATEGVKTFAETGKTDVLDAESQGNGGIYDEFMAPPIPIGVGKTQAEFFVDGNHSRVSLMSRLHPSPDWFVGIDTFDLCIQGKWVDAVTLEVDPTDAGTDEGYTFTAPNWKSDPQQKIYRLTSQYPNHTANAFYYPHLKKLPNIATFTFIKVKEYELSEVFYHEDSKQLSPQRYEYAEEETNLVHRGSIEPYQRKIPRPSVLHPQEPEIIKKPAQYKPPAGSIRNSIDPSYRNTYRNNTNANRGRILHRRAKIRRGPRNCRVSEWSEWSPCSETCKIGQKRRTRNVIKHARRGGNPCPKLVEQSWCGSAYCPTAKRTYFNWD